MNIQDLGAIGDLVGGAAVVVTLLYLAIQIKQNTKINASIIRQNFYDSTQQQILHAVESPGFNELINRGWTTDESLTGAERTQIWRHMQGVLIGYQGAFEQYKSGALPKEDWAVARVILRSFWLMDGRAKNDAWEQMSQGGLFTKDFLEEIEGLKEEALSYQEQLESRGLTL